MAPQELVVDAILFDMDGTLIDSTPAADATYQQFCQRHSLQATGHLHGVRMQDSIRQWFPKAQQSEVTEMAVRFEADLLDNAKALKDAGKQGLVILPGVKRLLEEIRSNPAAEEHYAIATSAQRLFATTALATAGIQPPEHLVTADQCTYGKPHPEPYEKAAALLGKSTKKSVVFEDAPAGIQAGLAAGSTVIAVCTSHTREQLKDVGAQFIVENLERVHVEWIDNKQIRIRIDQ